MVFGSHQSILSQVGLPTPQHSLSVALFGDNSFLPHAENAVPIK
jgi:hypothetical protein